MSSNHLPLEDLSNWLDDEHSGNHDAKHQRAGQHIEQCPTCTQRLEALQRLETATRDLVEVDEKDQHADAGWLDALLKNLVLETKAGRAIPLTGEHPLDTLTVTEGAVLAAVRRAGESVDGVLVGKTRLVGEVEEPGAPVTVTVNASVRQQVIIPEVAGLLRERVLDELSRVSELNVVAVDLTVEDLHSPATEQAAKYEEGSCG